MIGIGREAKIELQLKLGDSDGEDKGIMQHQMHGKITLKICTLIIPISVCYYTYLQNAITVWWERNILPNNVWNKWGTRLWKAVIKSTQEWTKTWFTERAHKCTSYELEGVSKHRYTSRWKIERETARCDSTEGISYVHDWPHPTKTTKKILFCVSVLFLRKSHDICLNWNTSAHW